MRVVVAYDISSDKSRQKLAKILSGILTRVQYSVFEGDVPRKVLKEALKRGLELVNPATDSLRVYYLCAACRSKVDAYGKSVKVERDSVTIL